MNISHVHKTLLSFGKLPNWDFALSRSKESTKFNSEGLISNAVVKMFQSFPLQHPLRHMR